MWTTETIKYNKLWRCCYQNASVQTQCSHQCNLKWNEYRSNAGVDVKSTCATAALKLAAVGPYITVGRSVPSSPKRQSLSRDLASGRCEVDLRFFHFSGKIKHSLVRCCLFFHPPSILNLTTLRLHNPICQPAWISVRDLRWCIGWRNWTWVT